MKIDTTARRLMAVLACTTVLATAAWAEDEATPIDETEYEVGDPGASDDGAIGEDGVVVDDGVIFETTVLDDVEVIPDEGGDDAGGEDLVGEDPGVEEPGAEDGTTIDDGEIVSIPDDCIDCNVVITTAEGSDRGGSEVERGGDGAGGTSFSRSGGSSGRPLCGSLQPHDMTPCDD